MSISSANREFDDEELQALEQQKAEEDAANAVLKEMEELTKKIKKFQERFQGKVSYEYKGYADIPDQTATLNPDGSLEIENEMSHELKKVRTFFFT